MTATGIIFDVKKFASHDGPGIRTTVFFKGCPLNCTWCHNPESRNPEPEMLTMRSANSFGKAEKHSQQVKIGREVSVAEVMRDILADRLFYEQSSGGVTFSGGEPMLQVEFLGAVQTACKKAGIHTVVDTSGQAPFEDFERILPTTDLFLYDLKVIDSALHKEHTGQPNDMICENLIRLAETGADIVIRVPLIPGLTDTDDNLEATTTFLERMPGLRRIDLLPYNMLCRDKHERYLLPEKIADWAMQSNDDITAMAARFERHGYTVKVGG